MAQPLELAGALKRTEKGNNDQYYGGGDVAWANMAEALAGVPVAIRPGKTIGIIEAGKVVEYIWPATGDVSGNPAKKTADVDLSQYYTKTQVDTLLTGLWDDRGNYDPSVTSAYPAAGGSGVSGSILKGDVWQISAAGTITGFGAVKQGDLVRALVDSPGQTPGNWAVLSVQLGYTAENLLNKKQAVNNSASEYPSSAAVILYVAQESTIRQNAENLKEDKLINFYNTQTASFNVVPGMVDKTTRCNSTVAMIATIADDNQFTIGAKFIFRQSGTGPVSLAGPGITFNAPQGLTTARQYSYLQIIKQAANIYSVTVIGDDPTKVDKVAGKGLSTEDLTTVRKNKIDSIVKGFTLCFGAPNNALPPDYFELAAQVTSVILKKASAFSYSLNDGTSYITPALPLTAASYINIPAGTWVIWRITFSANQTNASAYLKLA